MRIEALTLGVRDGHMVQHHERGGQRERTSERQRDGGVCTFKRPQRGLRDLV